MRIVATFPADSHAPITYPVAVTAGSKNPSAELFLDHLKSDEGMKVFKEFGFVPAAKSE